MKFQDGHQRQGDYAKQSNLTHPKKLINARIKIRFKNVKLKHFFISQKLEFNTKY